MFVRQESRDAYAVIRGFVYQVERTILVWLGLEKENILYFTCSRDENAVAQDDILAVRNLRKLIQEFDHEVGVEASTYTTVSERQRQVIRIGSAVAEDVYSSYIF